MKLVFVPHGPKVVGVSKYPPELGADPPMTMDGKVKMLALVPQLKALGPYNYIYSSLMDRACGAMCTVVKALDFEIKGRPQRVICIASLGQYSNLDDDGRVISYPGHETDNVLVWQKQGIAAVVEILSDLEDEYEDSGGRPREHPDRSTILVFSHRPILAGLVANSLGVTNTLGIQTILDDKTLVGKGYRVFSVSRTEIKLVE